MLFPIDPWDQAIIVFIFSIVRYLLFGGIAYMVLYVFFKRKVILHKIQQKWPTNKDYQREVTYSMITFLFFAIVPLIVNLPFLRLYSNIYFKIGEYGILYFVLAFPLMLVIHDSYFYWAHRMMHHPKLFKIFHMLHHKSTNPSPWAAFSFNPAEAIVESGIIYLFVFTIPLHPIHLLSFLIFMTVYNVYGHLGFELFPERLNDHPIGKWLNTSVNHNMHHQYFNGNYGLYFTFWDRVMHTMQKDYDKRFEEVTKANGYLRRKKLKPEHFK